MNKIPASLRSDFSDCRFAPECAPVCFGIGGDFIGIRSKKVNTLSLLGELIKNFLVPEDYRAFRMYVGKTALGLSKSDKMSAPPSVAMLGDPDQDSAEDTTAVKATKENLRAKTIRLYESRKGLEITVVEAAELAGLSERRIYELIQSGALKPIKTKGSCILLTQGEVRRLKESMEQKRTRQKLIARLAEHKKIRKRSAARWVSRQEKDGLSLEQILKNLQSHLFTTLRSRGVMSKKNYFCGSSGKYNTPS